VVVSLAVVLAACPCTYGVVSPLVYWLALRKALEHGVLVRSASVLEEIARVDAVAFDKTGTLTERDLSVTGFELADGASEAEVLGLLAALEEGQRHPVARAVLAYAEQRGAAPAELRRVTLAAGLGVSAIDMENREILLGAPRLLGGRGVDASAFVGARVVLARAGAPLAALRVGEAVRPEARATIDALASARVRAVVLTGDGAEGARRIADELSVPAFGELSAVEKIERLDALGPRAAMVGDGLNDAPALARVGPSFAMDGGTDLARGMAHVALLRPDLRLVPWAIGLARRAVSLARASLALSTAYNLLFLALAAAGALRPVWAGVAMATSSLLMVASAMRVTAFEGPGEASS
jgi:P-type E1-E2 ATPase